MNVRGLLGVFLCFAFFKGSSENFIDLTKDVSIEVHKMDGKIPIVESNGRLFVPFVIRTRFNSDFSQTPFAQKLRTYVDQLFEKHYQHSHGSNKTNPSPPEIKKYARHFGLPSNSKEIWSVNRSNHSDITGIPIVLSNEEQSKNRGTVMGIPVDLNINSVAGKVNVIHTNNKQPGREDELFKNSFKTRYKSTKDNWNRHSIKHRGRLKGRGVAGIPSDNPLQKLKFTAPGHRNVSNMKSNQRIKFKIKDKLFHPWKSKAKENENWKDKVKKKKTNDKLTHPWKHNTQEKENSKLTHPWISKTKEKARKELQNIWISKNKESNKRKLEHPRINKYKEINNKRLEHSLVNKEKKFVDDDSRNNVAVLATPKLASLLGINVKDNESKKDTGVNIRNTTNTKDNFAIWEVPVFAKNGTQRMTTVRRTHALHYDTKSNPTTLPADIASVPLSTKNKISTNTNPVHNMNTYPTRSHGNKLRSNPTGNHVTNMRPNQTGNHVTNMRSNPTGNHVTNMRSIPMGNHGNTLRSLQTPNHVNNNIGARVTHDNYLRPQSRKNNQRSHSKQINRLEPYSVQDKKGFGSLHHDRNHREYPPPVTNYRQESKSGQDLRSVSKSNKNFGTHSSDAHKIVSYPTPGNNPSFLPTDMKSRRRKNTKTKFKMQGRNTEYTDKWKELLLNTRTDKQTEASKQMSMSRNLNDGNNISPTYGFHKPLSLPSSLSRRKHKSRPLSNNANNLNTLSKSTKYLDKNKETTSKIVVNNKRLTDKSSIDIVHPTYGVHKPKSSLKSLSMSVHESRSASRTVQEHTELSRSKHDLYKRKHVDRRNQNISTGTRNDHQHDKMHKNAKLKPKTKLTGKGHKKLKSETEQSHSNARQFRKKRPRKRQKSGKKFHKIMNDELLETKTQSKYNEKTKIDRLPKITPPSKIDRRQLKLHSIMSANNTKDDSSNANLDSHIRGPSSKDQMKSFSRGDKNANSNIIRKSGRMQNAISPQNARTMLSTELNTINNAKSNDLFAKQSAGKASNTAPIQHNNIQSANDLSENTYKSINGKRENNLPTIRGKETNTIQHPRKRHQVTDIPLTDRSNTRDKSGSDSIYKIHRSDNKELKQIDSVNKEGQKSRKTESVYNGRQKTFDALHYPPPSHAMEGNQATPPKISSTADEVMEWESGKQTTAKKADLDFINGKNGPTQHRLSKADSIGPSNLSNAIKSTRRIHKKNTESEMSKSTIITKMTDQKLLSINRRTNNSKINAKRKQTLSRLHDLQKFNVEAKPAMDKITSHPASISDRTNSVNNRVIKYQVKDSIDRPGYTVKNGRLLNNDRNSKSSMMMSKKDKPPTLKQSAPRKHKEATYKDKSHFNPSTKTVDRHNARRTLRRKSKTRIKNNKRHKFNEIQSPNNHGKQNRADIQQLNRQQNRTNGVGNERTGQNIRDVKRDRTNKELDKQPTNTKITHLKMKHISEVRMKNDISNITNRKHLSVSNIDDVNRTNMLKTSLTSTKTTNQTILSVIVPNSMNHFNSTTKTEADSPSPVPSNTLEQLHSINALHQQRGKSHSSRLLRRKGSMRKFRKRQKGAFYDRKIKRNKNLTLDTKSSINMLHGLHQSNLKFDIKGDHPPVTKRLAKGSSARNYTDTSPKSENDQEVMSLRQHAYILRNPRLPVNENTKNVKYVIRSSKERNSSTTQETFLGHIGGSNKTTKFENDNINKHNVRSSKKQNNRKTIMRYLGGSNKNRKFETNNTNKHTDTQSQVISTTQGIPEQNERQSLSKHEQLRNETYTTIDDEVDVTKTIRSRASMHKYKRRDISKTKNQLKILLDSEIFLNNPFENNRTDSRSININADISQSMTNPQMANNRNMKQRKDSNVPDTTETLNSVSTLSGKTYHQPLPSGNAEINKDQLPFSINRRSEHLLHSRNLMPSGNEHTRMAHRNNLHNYTARKPSTRKHRKQRKYSHFRRKRKRKPNINKLIELQTPNDSMHENSNLPLTNPASKKADVDSIAPTAIDEIQKSDKDDENIVLKDEQGVLKNIQDNRPRNTENAMDIRNTQKYKESVGTREILTMKKSPPSIQGKRKLMKHRSLKYKEDFTQNRHSERMTKIAVNFRSGLKTGDKRKIYNANKRRDIFGEIQSGNRGPQRQDNGQDLIKRKQNVQKKQFVSEKQYSQNEFISGKRGKYLSDEKNGKLKDKSHINIIERRTKNKRLEKLHGTRITTTNVNSKQEEVFKHIKTTPSGMKSNSESSRPMPPIILPQEPQERHANDIKSPRYSVQKPEVSKIRQTMPPIIVPHASQERHTDIKSPRYSRQTPEVSKIRQTMPSIIVPTGRHRPVSPSDENVFDIQTPATPTKKEDNSVESAKNYEIRQQTPPIIVPTNIYQQVSQLKQPDENNVDIKPQAAPPEIEHNLLPSGIIPQTVRPPRLRQDKIISRVQKSRLRGTGTDRSMKRSGATSLMSSNMKERQTHHFMSTEQIHYKEENKEDNCTNTTDLNSRAMHDYKNVQSRVVEKPKLKDASQSGEILFENTERPDKEQQNYFDSELEKRHGQIQGQSTKYKSPVSHNVILETNSDYDYSYEYESDSVDDEVSHLYSDESFEERVPVNRQQRILNKQKQRVPLRGQQRVPMRGEESMPLRGKQRVPLRANKRVPVRGNQEKYSSLSFAQLSNRRSHGNVFHKSNSDMNTYTQHLSRQTQNTRSESDSDIYYSDEYEYETEEYYDDVSSIEMDRNQLQTQGVRSLGKTNGIRSSKLAANMHNLFERNTEIQGKMDEQYSDSYEYESELYSDEYEDYEYFDSDESVSNAKYANEHRIHGRSESDDLVPNTKYANVHHINRRPQSDDFMSNTKYVNAQRMHRRPQSDDIMSNTKYVNAQRMHRRPQSDDVMSNAKYVNEQRMHRRSQSDDVMSDTKYVNAQRMQRRPHSDDVMSNTKYVNAHPMHRRPQSGDVMSNTKYVNAHRMHRRPQSDNVMSNTKYVNAHRMHRRTESDDLVHYTPYAKAGRLHGRSNINTGDKFLNDYTTNGRSNFQTTSKQIHPRSLDLDNLYSDGMLHSSHTNGVPCNCNNG